MSPLQSLADQAADAAADTASIPGLAICLTSAVKYYHAVEGPRNQSTFDNRQGEAYRAAIPRAQQHQRYEDGFCSLESDDAGIFRNASPESTLKFYNEVSAIVEEADAGPVTAAQFSRAREEAEIGIEGGWQFSLINRLRGIDPKVPDTAFWEPDENRHVLFSDGGVVTYEEYAEYLHNHVETAARLGQGMVASTLGVASSVLR